jgi:polysaccharide export outer membrane protein
MRTGSATSGAPNRRGTKITLGRLPVVAILLVAVFSAGCGASLNDVNASAEIGGQSGAALGVASGAQVPSSATVSAPREATGDPATAAKAVRSPKTANSILAAATPGADGYKIGPQDVLNISVFRVSELNKTVQVAEAGTVNLPLVGDIPAAGMTAKDLEQSLTKILGSKYLQNPQVTVFIQEYNSQRVTVEGAVEKPGVYPYRGRISLLQLVATSGGFKDVANTTDVVVFRTTDGKRQAARFNVDEIKAGRGTDPLIMQGDVVVVTPSTAKAMYQDFLKALPVLGFFRPII